MSHAYIFVRQDISPEQQLIQFGHACAKMGALAYTRNYDEVNFVGIGVPNEEELVRAIFLMQDANIQYVFFKETDMNNEITAVASVPVEGHHRQTFKSYQTLRFVADL